MQASARTVGAAAFGLMAYAGCAFGQGYVQGSAGGTWTSWLDIGGVGYKLNTGYNIGVSGGINLVHLLGPSWDLRGDIMHSQNQYACCTAHLGGTSVMANLIYHIDLGMKLKPYIGAGLGAVAINFGNATTGPHETRTNFGYQALAGIEYPLAGKLSAFGEYRYIDAGHTDFSAVGPVEYRTHNVMIGLKLNL
jgi:opacity protein-like surface antigen